MRRPLLLAALLLVGGCAAPAPEADPAARSDYTVARGDVSIRVVAEGAGPTILLLPSRGRDSLDYDAVAEGIADQGYRVLRPQPRGIAGSTGPLDGITLHDLAADVAGVIEDAGTGPAVIVGHAYGNWVARMTAVDHPERVRGVVIAAAAASDYPPELSVRVTRSSDTSRPDAERREDLQVAFFAPGNDPSPWLEGWYPEASKAQRAAGTAVDQDTWWSAGTAPMLDLIAEQDAFRPPASFGEIAAEFGDRVQVETIPRAGHALFPEQPTAVVDAVVDWVHRLPAP